MKSLIIISSFYNESINIGKFIDSIKFEIDKEKLNLKLNLLLIDDGSSDNSISIVKEKLKTFKGLYYIKLIKNFGKYNVLNYALRIAKDYDYYIFMDSDGEHPPRYLSKIIYSLKDNKIVLTKRKKYSKNILTDFLRKIMSSLFDFRNNKIETQISDYMGFSNKIRSEIIKFKRLSYLRFFLQNFSSKKIIEIDIDKKTNKKTSYGFIKTLKSGLDVIIFYNLIPFRHFLTLLIFIVFAYFFTGNNIQLFVIILVSIILSLFFLIIYILNSYGENVNSYPISEEDNFLKK